MGRHLRLSLAVCTTWRRAIPLLLWMRWRTCRSGVLLGGICWGTRLLPRSLFPLWLHGLGGYSRRHSRSLGWWCMLSDMQTSHYSHLLSSILARFLCRLWGRRLRLTRLRLILPIVSVCLCMLRYPAALAVLP